MFPVTRVARPFCRLARPKSGETDTGCTHKPLFIARSLTLFTPLGLLCAFCICNCDHMSDTTSERETRPESPTEVQEKKTRQGHCSTIDTHVLSRHEYYNQMSHLIYFIILTEIYFAKISRSKNFLACVMNIHVYLHVYISTFVKV